MKKKAKSDPVKGKSERKNPPDSLQEEGPSLGSADAFRETENPRQDSEKEWTDEELDERLTDQEN